MPPRPTVRRDRDNVDYSAIGKQGRRTGVTLEQRPLDKDGMEEISGIFSSPRKPSPLKNMVIMESVEEAGSGFTPKQTLSVRRSTRGGSVPPPRSSSPRKSGISGTAKKSNGVDIFSTRKSLQPDDPEDRENTPLQTPTRNIHPRRFSPSPEKSQLRDITTSRQRPVPTPRLPTPLIDEISSEEIAASVDEEVDHVVEAEPARETNLEDADTDFVPLGNDDDDTGIHGNNRTEVSEYEGRPQSEELGTPSKIFDPTNRAQTLESERSAPSTNQNQANSRKKRKSDTLEQDAELPQSPIPTKALKTSKKMTKAAPVEVLPAKAPSAKAKGKQALRNKDPNTKMSARQEKEVQDYVEKIRAQPGPKRSLYILRRETPADDSVTHTRSGRVSVKPLAYWRNERCIYGGSPGGASLKDGARFPLNSIKEIVRTEEYPEMKRPRKKLGKRKGKGKKREATSDDSSSESELDDQPKEDPNAEPWETKTGTLRGIVSSWDQSTQTPAEEEETIELAHAPAAIQTREVKGSSLHEGPTFKYAKLLSTNFFGTGIVDLPPGGFKRPKNSRKMHMSFFVVKGRVTVTVGSVGDDETGSMNRFSIGKGGFWQVPRGNQYSIENELDKSARIFFSQACEPTPVEPEE